jgi:hypothetical protein
MRLLLTVLSLCTTPAAFAQDPVDTGEPSELGSLQAAVLPLQVGTVITYLDGTNGELSEDGFYFSLTMPSLSDGISKIPDGSFILIRQEDGSFDPHRVQSKFWVLPDSHYTEAIYKARQLEICRPALDEITETSLQWMDRAYTAQTKCLEQFDGDEALIQDLTGQVQTFEARALLAEDRLKVARRRQAVAWAITGGLVLGASTVIVVSVSN